ncbi:YbaB/EbfC family nucleoid-associated protein [Ruminococcaceae bacterium OttesenSCG-928-O06]|nr:YbaB/EbfC family nucleoid-associated protein [Ruminococcaceae bacterium OttesenSCG-928-O06]
MKARLPEGYGKQNVNKLMQQAQQMQEQMQAKQAELEETEYTVKAAGGMVEVVMRGDYQVNAVHVQPDIIDPDDAEMMEDMIAAAFNEAVRTVKEAAENEMAEISGSFNLPGLDGLM